MDRNLHLISSFILEHWLYHCDREPCAQYVRHTNTVETRKFIMLWEKRCYLIWTHTRKCLNFWSLQLHFSISISLSCTCFIYGVQFKTKIELMCIFYINELSMMCFETKLNRERILSIILWVIENPLKQFHWFSKLCNFSRCRINPQKWLLKLPKVYPFAVASRHGNVS